MASKRIARLNEQFRREITEILRREVRDPRVGSPTITGVEITPDLWMARVYVRPGPELGRSGPATEPPSESPVPSDSGTPSGSPSHPPTSSQGDLAGELLEGLEAAAPFVRRELGKVLSVRRVPELRFQLDRSLEHAARIEELLREVRPTDPDPVDPETSNPADTDPGDRRENP